MLSTKKNYIKRWVHCTEQKRHLSVPACINLLHYKLNINSIANSHLIKESSPRFSTALNFSKICFQVFKIADQFSIVLKCLQCTDTFDIAYDNYKQHMQLPFNNYWMRAWGRAWYQELFGPRSKLSAEAEADNIEQPHSIIVISFNNANARQNYLMNQFISSDLI